MAGGRWDWTTVPSIDTPVLYCVITASHSCRVYIILLGCDNLIKSFKLRTCHSVVLCMPKVALNNYLIICQLNSVSIFFKPHIRMFLWTLTSLRRTKMNGHWPDHSLIINESDTMRVIQSKQALTSYSTSRFTSHNEIYIPKINLFAMSTRHPLIYIHTVILTVQLRLVNSVRSLQFTSYSHRRHRRNEEI